jgi:hypothetical protein
MELKLRTIVGGDRNVQGLTVPTDIAIFFSGCKFSIEKSGTCIVFYSGTSKIPTIEETERYDFSDCRIGSIII